MKKLMLWLFLVVLLCFNIPIGICVGEFDSNTVVISVTDGDTFETTSEGTIRLADVDAPEYNEFGYQASKDYLISLIYGKTVYLDIDDIDQIDSYGRLICVVYVNYNSTHYINVNQALLVGDYAEISNYENEFSVDSWELYVNKNNIPEFPSWIILPLFLVVTFVAILAKKRSFQSTI